MKKRIISGIVVLGLFFVILALYKTPVLNFVLAVAAVIAVFEMAITVKSDVLKPLFFLSVIFAALSPFTVYFGAVLSSRILYTAYILLVFVVTLFEYKTVKIEKTTLMVCLTLFIVFSFCSVINLRDVYKVTPVYRETDGLLFILLP